MLRTGGLVIALAAVSAWYFFGHLSPASAKRPVLPAAAEEVSVVPQEQAPKQFRDVSLARNLPPAYPRPESQWRAHEKEQYLKLLSKGTYDLMVVPFQVDGYAFDRATRSLMTAELSYAIGDMFGNRLPDPYLLSRALGEGARQYDPSVVVEVARKLGVERIIWGHVGHNRQNAMELTVQELSVNELPAKDFPPGPGRMRFPGIAFSDVKPPAEVFHSMLPEVLEVLGVEVPEQKGERKERQNVQEVLIPGEPMELFSHEDANPVRDAYFYQFLAALTPEHAERIRERFIERSLLAVYRIPPAVPGYRSLKARAYMHLGYRPAVIHMLSPAANTEEQAILAAQNGNLPELRKLAPEVESSVGRILSEFDVNRLAAAYRLIEKEASAKAAEDLQLPGDTWPFLASRAMQDWGLWAQFDNVALKQLLDQAFPVAGYTAKAAVEGAYALGSFSEISEIIKLSVVEHVARLMEAQSEIWCCAGSSRGPGPSDYLDLVQGIASDNLLRRAEFLITIQVSLKRAKAFLTSIETAYDGHPRFAFLRAKLNAAPETGRLSSNCLPSTNEIARASTTILPRPCSPSSGTMWKVPNGTWTWLSTRGRTRNRVPCTPTTSTRRYASCSTS